MMVCTGSLYLLLKPKKYVCDIFIKRFTFAISSFDEFLFKLLLFAITTVNR